MNKVKIEIIHNINTIKYLIDNNIKYKNLIIKDNKIILICEYNDYKKIKKKYKTKIIKYYGKLNIKYFLKYYKYTLVSTLISLILLFLLTNTIFNININTNNIDLKNKLENVLKEYNIEKYKKKKSYQELENIKNNILKNNSDILEWIEIEEIGCNYNINVTERIIKTQKDNTNIKDIIAQKDGVIKHINVIKGTKLKEIGDYVKKGEVIVSSEIKKNDEIIGYTTAEATVYAETWYIVNVTVPYQYKEYVKTDKTINRYYLDIFGLELTLSGKYETKNMIKQKILILDKPYLFFKLYKEIKNIYEYKNYNITEEEAFNEALKRSQNNIENMLGDKEYIISKKVLKKNPFRSKISIEVFFKVYEDIGST